MTSTPATDLIIVVEVIQFVSANAAFFHLTIHLLVTFRKLEPGAHHSMIVRQPIAPTVLKRLACPADVVVHHIMPGAVVRIRFTDIANLWAIWLVRVSGLTIAIHAELTHGLHLSGLL